MNSSDIAAFADVLAAAGVIASLLFLAFQIRAHTKTVRNQHYESMLDRLTNNFARPLDEWVATTLERGKQNFEDLSAPERLTFDAWANEYVVCVTNIATLGSQGIFNPGVAAMVDRRLEWFFKYPGVRQWWRGSDRHPPPCPF